MSRRPPQNDDTIDLEDLAEQVLTVGVILFFVSIFVLAFVLISISLEKYGLLITSLFGVGVSVILLVIGGVLVYLSD